MPLPTRRKRFLIFNCPRCYGIIHPQPNSTIARDFVAARLSFREAVQKVILAHYRHAHTDYEKIILVKWANAHLVCNKKAEKLIELDGGFEAIIGGRQP